jgi:hypothetical protein
MRANVRTATVVTAAMLSLLVAPGAAAQEPPLLPDLPAFAIEGEIRHEAGRWQADNFYARVGDLPMTGNLVVDLGGCDPLHRGLPAVSVVRPPRRSLAARGARPATARG